MKTNNFLFLLLTSIIITSLTGCYTQVATTDPEPYTTTTIYKQSPESDNYYSEDGEQLDSSYYSEIDPETDESVTIVNQYYNDYPYNYFDYAFLPIGIGISWYWGWGSYYSYWPYYPSYGWYYPSYCYYPSYYYYDPYYCYGGYYPYYGYDYGYGYGYNSRNDYVTRIRNNSGGRNNSEHLRDPLVTTSNGSINRGRDDINLGRDLTVERNIFNDRSVDLHNRTGEVTREVVGLKENEIIKTSKRNDVVINDLDQTNDIRNNKQLGLEREISTNKSLGINNSKDISRENVKSNNLSDISTRINKENRVGTQTKKVFNTENSNRNNSKQNVGTNNNTKQTNVKNNSKNNQTPKKDNNTRTYNPPKQNNNPPRTYSQPNSNNNTPRSYSPPSGNNSPRSYSPPTRNSGSNNSGNRKR